MLKKMHSFLFVFFIALTSNPVRAEMSDTTVDRILDLSGTTEQIGQHRDSIKIGLDQAQQQQQMQLPEEVYNIIVNASFKAYAPAPILATIRASIKSSLTEEEGRQLLDWYEADVGRQITYAEEMASAAEGVNEMLQLAPTLLGANADQQKLALVQKIDELVHATDMAVKLQKSVAITIYSALAGVADPKQGCNPHAIANQIEPAIEQARPQIHNMVILSLYYAYRNVELKKLDQYVAFMKTPASLKLHKVLTESMSVGLQNSTDQFAQEIALFLKQYQYK